MLLGGRVPEPTPPPWAPPCPHICQGCIDVVVGVTIGGDEEGQAAVRRQDVHAAVLVPVPGQQGDAALLHIQRRRDRVQRLQGVGRGKGGDSCVCGASSQPHEGDGAGLLGPFNGWRN